MTSNQIAAASQREDVRHNKAAEEETARHNIKTEENEAERNRINETYNQQSLELQDKWNALQLEFQKADADRKNEIQQQLADIKQEQQDLDEWYKRNMTEINILQASADASYKESMASINAFNAAIEAKRVYYEGQKTEASIADLKKQRELQEKQLNATLHQIEVNYTLGLLSRESREKEINLAKQKYELEKKQWEDYYAEQQKAKTNLLNAQTEESKARKVYEGINAGTRIIGTAVDAVDAVMPF